VDVDAGPDRHAAPLCGNGTIDAGEQCDGAADSACPGACTPLCQCATCGDGQINQPNEELRRRRGADLPRHVPAELRLAPVSVTRSIPSVCLYPSRTTSSPSSTRRPIPGGG